LFHFLFCLAFFFVLCLQIALGQAHVNLNKNKNHIHIFSFMLQIALGQAHVNLRQKHTYALQREASVGLKINHHFYHKDLKHNFKTNIKIQRWDNLPARQGECLISESIPSTRIKHRTS